MNGKRAMTSRGRWTFHPRTWDEERRCSQDARWQLDDSGWYLRLDRNYHPERRYRSWHNGVFDCMWCWIPREKGRRRWRHARWFLDREERAPDGSTYSLVPQCTHRDRLAAAMAAAEQVYDERIMKALANLGRLA